MGTVKGDRIEVVIDVGEGTRTFEIAASRAGRRVEVTTGRGMIDVTEVTRTGQPVRSARFMASRVVAIVEYPAGDPVDEVPHRSESEHPRLDLDVEA